MSIRRLRCPECNGVNIRLVKEGELLPTAMPRRKRTYLCTCGHEWYRVAWDIKEARKRGMRI